MGDQDEDYQLIHPIVVVLPQPFLELEGGGKGNIHTILFHCIYVERHVLHA